MLKDPYGRELAYPREQETLVRVNDLNDQLDLLERHARGLLEDAEGLAEKIHDDAWADVEAGAEPVLRGAALDAMQASSFAAERMRYALREIEEARRGWRKARVAPRKAVAG